MAYRVRSLDGGGVWTVVQARALIAFYGEQANGHQALQDFDLVAGTSGSSIVLGGLVENWTAPGPMSVAQSSYFCKLPMDAIDPTSVACITDYSDCWLAGQAPNQPIRMDGDSLTPEIGHAWFHEAAAWAALKQAG